VVKSYQENNNEKCMADKILDKKRQWVISKVRENLKNTKTTDNITWFDLAPYRNRPIFPDASTIESILEKADEFWKVIKITERRHSRYEETSRNPEVNWLVLKIDREKFTKLCHEYGIKGPDEDDEDKESENENSSEILEDKVNQQNNDKLQEVELITIVVRNPGSRNDKLWLVFNNDFSNNVEFNITGKRSGESYIKTLLDLSDDREEEYSSQIATSINSKIFARKEISGKYRQKTIVEKDGDKFRISKNVKVIKNPMAFLNKEQLKFFPRN
jgi:hypothetical protein